MKEIFPGVAGNTLLKERLAPKLLAGDLPHALILEGKAGSGRRTFAREIAMAAACENRADPTLPLPCGKCEACRKIGGDLSPDILRVARAPGKMTLGVEAVRGLRESVRAVPNDLDLKIYIIEDADTMTVQAQNALLLTLEEPPRYVLFLLLATDATALLETIRSRAPIYRTQPVEEREMQEYLIAHSPEAARLFRDAPEEAEGILRLSGGSIGEALRHIGGADRATLLQYRANAGEICRLLSGRGSPAALLTLLLTFPQDREELAAQLGVLRLALRDLVLLSRTENAPLCFYTDRETAAETAVRLPTSRWMRCIAATEAAISALAANANTRLTLTGLFDRLGSAG